VFLSDRVVVLSGRPGRVVTEVTINLPRPRDWRSLLNDERFVTYRETLTRLIHGANAPAGSHV
jgi:NitT/TauT family transport system ATP-binding protein